MARLSQRGRSGHRVAVVDDDDGLRAGLVRLLEREGHEVQGAGDVASAMELARSWRPHLMLLD